MKIRRFFLLSLFVPLFWSPVCRASSDEPDLLSAPLEITGRTVETLTQTLFNLGDIHVGSSRLSSKGDRDNAMVSTRTTSVHLAEDFANSSRNSIPEVLMGDSHISYTDDLGQGQGARIDLRGFGGEAKQALVLVDGLRAVEPFDNSVTWSLYPRSFVERVDVMPGGNSAIYGEGALSGVIALKSKEPTQDLKIVSDTALGSYALFRQSASASGTTPGGVGLWIGGSYEESNGYRQNADHENIASQIVTQWPLAEFLKLDDRFFYADGETGIAGPLLREEALQNRRQKDPDGQFGDKFEDNLIQNAMKLEYEAEPVGVFVDNLFGYRLRDQDSLQSFGGAFPGTSLNDISTESFSNVLQISKDWAIADKWTEGLILGAEWSIDDIHNPFLFDDRTFGPFRSERSIDRRLWGLFIQNRARYADHLYLDAGMRYDRIDWAIYDLLSPDLEKHKKADELSPTISVALALNPQWTLHGGYSFAFKVPDSNTLIFETPNIFSPNPNIDPSLAKHAEWGLRFADGHKLSVDGQFFLIATEKEILFNDITNTNENFDTDRRGIELRGNVLLVDGLSAKLSYAWTQAEFDGGAFDEKSIPLVPAHRWSLGLDWEPGCGWRISTEVSGVKDRLALNDFNNLFEAEDYWTTDLGLAKTLPKGEIYARFNNLFGEEYSSFVTSNGVDTVNVNPAPGFHMEFGYRLEV